MKIVELPACGACGARLTPDRVMDVHAKRTTTACGACLTVEEHEVDEQLAWISRTCLATGTEIARERERLSEELALGTLERALVSDAPRFRRLSIPELFAAARPLFRRPATLRRAYGTHPGPAYLGLPIRFLASWDAPRVVPDGARLPVAGFFGDHVLLGAPDGGMPFAVLRSEVDLGMPSTRLVVRGSRAWEGTGRIFVSIEGEEHDSGLDVECMESSDPYGSGDGRGWMAALHDGGEVLYLDLRNELWNNAYHTEERQLHRSDDRARTWTRVAALDLPPESLLLHEIRMKGRV